MRPNLKVLTLLFIGVQVVCHSIATAVAQPESEPVAVKDLGPMASFARMVTGEWRLGTVQVDTWRWGPGKHSMHVQTVGSDGRGSPWRELMVYYWHPGHKQVCLLGFHPDIPGIGRGVASGKIEFNDQTVTTTFDLYQPSDPVGKCRKMGGRWVFDGPNKYHEVLLEDNGNGLVPLAEWDYVRSVERSKHPALAVDKAPTPSKNLTAFESLLGRWRVRDGGSADGDIEVQSTLEWVEYLDVIALRGMERTQVGGSTHLLDAYMYHHVGTDSLHCLALSASGDVYEGRVSALEDGMFQLNLKGHERDGTMEYLVQFNAEAGKTLRQRVWSIAGSRRTLVLDVSHERINQEQGESTPVEVAP